MSNESFVVDAAKLWNRAPEDITNAKTFNIAKCAIKKYSKSKNIASHYLFKCNKGPRQL